MSSPKTYAATRRARGQHHAGSRHGLVRGARVLAEPLRVRARPRRHLSVAFVVAVNQFRPLLGERGLLPVPRFVRTVRFRDAPSLFQLRYSDRLLAVVAWAGVVLAASVIVGLPQAGPLWAPILVWLALWALY